MKLVQFQVVAEQALRRGVRGTKSFYTSEDYVECSVIYALDSNGGLWRKVFDRWEQIENPNTEI